jgi:hypothetical protein
MILSNKALKSEVYTKVPECFICAMLCLLWSRHLNKANEPIHFTMTCRLCDTNCCVVLQLLI